MTDESFDIELFDGPFGGESHSIPKLKESLKMGTYDVQESVMKTTWYLLRVSDGNPVQLPNGRYAYDWNGIEE